MIRVRWPCVHVGGGAMEVLSVLRRYPQRRSALLQHPDRRCHRAASLSRAVGAGSLGLQQDRVRTYFAWSGERGEDAFSDPLDPARSAHDPLPHSG